jgi:hypothetical protein
MQKSWSDKRESRWVSDLKVGEEVIIALWTWKLAVVEAVTEDTIVANGVRFYRDSGFQVKGVGFGGARMRLKQATPERILTIKMDDMVSEIQDFHEWGEATPEEVELIFEIVEKVRERRIKNEI